MATLTADELIDIRDTTGAPNATEYSDAKIQLRYDEAVLAAPDSTSIFPFTYVYVLRKLWGIRIMEVDRITDHGDKIIRSQIRDATKSLLDYWERYTGLTQGTQGAMVAGALILDLDYDSDDLEAGL